MLPETFLRTWEPDTIEKVGGWLGLAGADLDDLFLVKGFPDHPWLGWRVHFPGIGTGKIIRSLFHPKGYLTFDLLYDDPVPKVDLCNGKIEVPFKNNPGYHWDLHRYTGQDLLEILKLLDGTATPPN